MDINKICPGCMKEIENRESMASCPNCGYDFRNCKVEPHQLQPLTILAGKYIVGRVIGEGGFGISYLGYDLNLELAVAIKEFYPNGFVTRESNVTTTVSMYSGKNEADVGKWRDGFISEARNLAKFSNLNGIVEVRDFFNENCTAYIVMEYIDGITLKQYLKQNGGTIPADQTFQMMEPVIRSLSKVHDTGMIHRDISPDNIMITKYGGMKLLDFGAAREFAGNAEKSLSIMLKPGYAPEEQYRSRGKQGPWSDVYALSATIYKCITGVTPVESMERMREDTLKWPREMGINITDAQEAALRQGMAVYAENRLQSMDELYKALYFGQTVTPPQAPPVPPQAPVQPQIQAPAQPQMQMQPAGYAAAAQSRPASGISNSQTKIILLAAAGAFALMLLIVCIALIPRGSSEDDRQASKSSQTQNEQADGNLADEASNQSAAEENRDDSEDITAQVNEISSSVSGAGSVEEIGGALDKFLELAKTYGNKDNLGEQTAMVYERYQAEVLKRINTCNEQEPSAALYKQISSDIDTALGYVEQFKNCDIGVNSGEIEALVSSIKPTYKSRLVSVFDSYAENEISANGVVSRSELWAKMEGVYDTDLYDTENPNDPLRLRYAAALALRTDSELDKLGGDVGGKIQKIYEVIIDTDYCPYLVYKLAELGDSNAVRWYDVYRDYGSDFSYFEELDAAYQKNYVYFYYTMPEFEQIRENFRKYMSNELV